MGRATNAHRLGLRWCSTRTPRLLVVYGVDPALAGALALIRAVRDEEPGDADDGKDGEKNERKHKELPWARALFLKLLRRQASFHSVRCGLGRRSRLAQVVQ